MKVGNFEILDTMWFTEMMETKPIGIVTGRDTITGQKIAYIGTGDGHDPGLDSRKIVAGGAKLYHFQMKKVLEFVDSK